MAGPQPNIGDWYIKKEGGALFEVVAFDDDDGTIEIQYFDGTVEEMDIEDWEGQWDDGALEAAEPPEDWSGWVDLVREHHESGFDLHGHCGERLPGAGACDAEPGASVEQRAVHRAQDQLAPARQEPVRHGVERKARVRAAVHVSPRFIADPHEKAAQRPVTRAEREAARTRILDVSEAADHALDIKRVHLPG